MKDAISFLQLHYLKFISILIDNALQNEEPKDGINFVAADFLNCAKFLAIF